MKKHTVRILALLGVMVLWLSGCASTKTQPQGLGAADTPKTQKIEPEARHLYFQAERAFSAKNLDEAKRLFLQVKAKFPRGKAAMMSTYRLGTIHYYQEDYPSASREFEAYLQRYPASDLSFDVAYNLAAAEFQQGHYERAYSVLQRLKPSEVHSQGPRRAEVVYQLTAQAASALGNHSAAVAAYANQMQLPLDENKRTMLTENIDVHLAKIQNQAELTRLESEVSEPATRQKISQRLAALTAPSSIGPGELPMPSAGDTTAETAPKPLSGSGTSAERTNIGVILPLSGKFAPYGQKALEGILLAAGVYFRSQNADYRVFVEDSAGSPAAAQQAVDKLVNRDHVMAILGPLGYKEAVSVGDRAQQLGVMNLSLAPKEGISEKGPYLFQNALTPRVQLENLVQYCVRSKEFKRFAILAPSSAFGKDMANQFWELVERYGGHVVAFQLYNPDEKDFQAPIKELTGLSNPTKYRRLEQAKLWEWIKEQKAKTGKEPKSRLQPIADFDAIFIPDSPKTAATIAQNMAYFDVKGVSLLGTTEWNNDQLYRRGGRNVEGAIFPGGLSLGTKNSRQKEFIRLYTDAYGSAPDLLASQAYEAMELVGTALRKSSNDRNDLVNQLISLKDFETPLGNVTFDATRIAKRKMPIFTLEPGGNIVEQ